MFDLITTVQTHLDKKRKTGAVFFDFSKAFDTVDKDILLSKLKEIGVVGTAHNWFNCFLTNRRQFVELGDNKSSLRTVSCGVPQGSILGPLLFLIYVNDIKDIGLKGEVFMYADDLAMVYNDESLQNMENVINEDLLKLGLWVRNLKLTINTNKTKYMLFNQEAISTINIEYKGRLIEKVQQFKHLGLYIDSKLSWNYHIDKMKGKLSAIAGVFRRLQNVLPSHLKLSVYHSLFNSHIIYGLVLWGGAFQYKIKEMQKIKNRAIKNIFGYSHLTSTDFIHKQHHLLQIHQQHKYLTSLLVFEITNNIIRTTTNITFRSQQHNRNLRRNRLHAPVVNTTQYMELDLVLTFPYKTTTVFPTLYSIVEETRS